eukprot:gnl/TRDRNA2_/TRDRNA2_124445_c2_seq1.p1 gnl/TRDRNA2_/TRDRNA2_124445_c2~~gnl/TRDRNA2_/TRDRNA2_124445_c2_seq1.p1  ORF type:complete len:522 (+),score=68.33 gnl/TRDRNA2_/TRDRNA2_124445_c2_seq1:119-1567(+)
MTGAGLIAWNWAARSLEATAAGGNELRAQLPQLLEMYGLRIVASLVLAASLSYAARQAGTDDTSLAAIANSGGEAVNELAQKERGVRVVRALMLASLYGLLGVFAFLSTGPKEAIEHVKASLDGSPLYFLSWLSVASLSSCGMLAVLMNVAHVCSPSFSARSLGFVLASSSLFRRGLTGYRWITMVVLFANLAEIMSRNRTYLDRAAKVGQFHFVRPHLVGGQCCWDGWRTSIATVIWKLLALPWMHFMNELLPDELRVYACEIPIFNLGRDVDLGIAAHFSQKAAHLSQGGQGLGPVGQGLGKGADAADGAGRSSANGRGAAQRRQKPPQFFVCNVGYIAESRSRGMNDMQRTMNALREVWQEFKQPDMRGLVSNVVCVFPQLESQVNCAKEINLSAWEDQQAAHEWYVKSPGHRYVMQQHSGGYLQTFGNLLASLEPLRPIRYQDRCRHCARLVESRVAGHRAPRHCGVCGGPTFRYPLF